MDRRQVKFRATQKQVDAFHRQVKKDGLTQNQALLALIEAYSLGKIKYNKGGF